VSRFTSIVVVIGHYCDHAPLGLKHFKNTNVHINQETDIYNMEQWH